MSTWAYFITKQPHTNATSDENTTLRHSDPSSGLSLEALILTTVNNYSCRKRHTECLQSKETATALRSLSKLLFPNKPD